MKIIAANPEIGEIFTYLTEYLGIKDTWSFFRIVIDIGIVSFVVYKLAQLLKDTRALQLIKGILLVLVISLLADFIGLTTVSYLTSLALQILPFIVIITFAPEIRRALEGIGKNKLKDFFRSISYQESQETARMIDEVVNAVEGLVRDKVGALIVFEKDINLGEIVRTGVIIDSVVSSQLLQLIFIPNTPLHDGAVIIRNNKIHAAACVLPLTGDLHISKELGTRHRAGIGVTETSDSVSIIVSEETSKVSIARRGTLIRNITPNNLRTILTNEFVRKDDKRKKDIFTFWKGRSK
ncbi:MAG TPA: diadenylate cyclase CdaA [Clostridia bacterium]|nr:TIGR00159 family protein [Clostridiaceae bacterium]HPZ51323.1 diadenylate cyclase CdaA [Clostridia bacterium]